MHDKTLTEEVVFVSTVRDEVIAQCPDVQASDLPSSSEADIWQPWVLWADGVDEQGRFLARCPLHDKPSSELPSALVSFNKGMFWCTGEVSCHAPKRAMSMVNLFIRLAERCLQEHHE